MTVYMVVEIRISGHRVHVPAGIAVYSCFCLYVAVMPRTADAELRTSTQQICACAHSVGKGGRVDTTDSAVIAPTGYYCQDERSQHKNKAKALSVLG